MSLYSGESSTSFCNSVHFEAPLPILPPALMHYESQRASNSNPLEEVPRGKLAWIGSDFAPVLGYRDLGTCLFWSPQLAFLPAGSALAQGEALSYIRILTLAPSLCVSISLCLRASMAQRELREGPLDLWGGSQR